MSDRITIVVEDGDRDPRSFWVRARRFIKLALRSFGLRVVSTVETPAPEPHPTHAAGAVGSGDR